MLPTEGVLALTTEDLLNVIRNLLGYKHVINYTGTHTLDTIYEIVSRCHPVESMLKDPLPYRYLTAREPEETEIYLYDREGAQARVRLEFGDVMFNAIEVPVVHLFNNYFAGGMSGIVFQELREARALAYMAGARYLLGYRADDQNLMIGIIQTQTDKTLEATEAFIDLIENIPASPERFSLARESTLEEFRTGKIGFRSIANAVRAWERRNQEPDPRKAYFDVFQQSELDQVLEFHQNHLKGRPMLISIVGDTARMDVDALEQVGKVVRISEDMIFVD
jgi:predicted Zn-dependent peptidase